LIFMNRIMSEAENQDLIPDEQFSKKEVIL